MSLTRSIKSKDRIYYTIRNSLNLSFCNCLINHHSNLSLVHKPFIDTNYLMVGMSVIYGLRDFLTADTLWHSTVAGRYFDYPFDYEIPIRYMVMSMMDSIVRRGNVDSNECIERVQLNSLLKPSIEDLNSIINSFPYMFEDLRFSNSLKVRIEMNPTFKGSYIVKGADANLIIGDSLYEIRTTGKRSPLDLDSIIQQIGYVALDLDNEYELNKISWYYSRQQVIITHLIKDFVKDINALRTDLVEEYNSKLRLISI